MFIFYSYLLDVKFSKQWEITIEISIQTEIYVIILLKTPKDYHLLLFSVQGNWLQPNNNLKLIIVGYHLTHLYMNKFSNILHWLKWCINSRTILMKSIYLVLLMINIKMMMNKTNTINKVLNMVKIPYKNGLLHSHI